MVSTSPGAAVLRKLYTVDGMEIQAIATRFGVAHNTVANWLDKEGLRAKAKKSSDGTGAHLKRRARLTP